MTDLIFKTKDKDIMEEIEKIHNLPVPDDAPWLNLSQEEVNDLRNKKFELTQYGKQKLRKMMNDNSTIDEMIEIAEEREAANRELEKDT